MKRKILSLLLVTGLLSGCGGDNGTGLEVFPPNVTTDALTASGLAWDRAVITGTVVFDGAAPIEEAGVVYSEEANFDPGLAFDPDAEGVKAVPGSYDEASGRVSVTLTGLHGATEYYARLYTRNSEAVGFGNQIVFTTPEETRIPEVATLEVTAASITHFSAELNGEIVDLWNLPLEEAGFVYSDREDFDPETESGRRIVLPTLPTSAGKVSATAVDFQPATTYYVAFYAVNSLGTSYGGKVRFTTVEEPAIPGVSLTLPAYGSEGLTHRSIALRGTLVSSKSDISECGVLYSTDPDLDVAAWTRVPGTEIPQVGAAFEQTLEGLDDNTLYYIRTYAVNESGIGYSEAASVRTAVGDVYDETLYYFEVSFTYKGIEYVWLDRNLGAKRVAESMDDSEAYGWYYQWGRPSDGHQLSASATIAVTTDASGIVNNDPATIVGKFVTTTQSCYDWRPGAEHKAGGASKPMGEQDKLWSTEPGGGPSNPCPEGYRVPTNTEWSALLNQAKGDAATLTAEQVFEAFKLPLAGRRVGSGSLATQGTTAYYWACTFLETGSASAHRPYMAQYLNNFFTSTATGMTGHGYTVRCIKE